MGLAIQQGRRRAFALEDPAPVRSGRPGRFQLPLQRLTDLPPNKANGRLVLSSFQLPLQRLTVLPSSWPKNAGPFAGASTTRC